MTIAGTVLNIDCVTNTDEVVKEWVKSLVIIQGVTRMEGEDLKRFIPLTLGGKVYEWFGALPEETKVRYLGGTPTTNAQTIINTIENEIRPEFLGEDYALHPVAEKRKRKPIFMGLAQLDHKLSNPIPS